MSFDLLKDRQPILVRLCVDNKVKKTIAIIISVFIAKYCGGQSFTNASLESWSSPSVCETNTPPDGWSNYSNVGLGPDEGNLGLCPSTIPPAAADGNIFARCLAGNPNTGEGMYQNVSGFSVGALYTLSYNFCGTNRWGGSFMAGTVPVSGRWVNALVTVE